MNLKNAVLRLKMHFGLTDQEVADELQISRQQVVKINKGYREGIVAKTLLRLSKYFRIAIDELLDNKILPSAHHLPDNAYEYYASADRDYEEFSIKKGDCLYIRPFTHCEDKTDRLVIVQRDKKMVITKYDADKEIKEVVLYQVIGISRLLVK